MTRLLIGGALLLCVIPSCTWVAGVYMDYAVLQRNEIQRQAAFSRAMRLVQRNNERLADYRERLRAAHEQRDQANLDRDAVLTVCRPSKTAQRKRGRAA